MAGLRFLRFYRKSNAFIAAIFIMGILATLGIIYMWMGFNTKNLIRRAFIDQVVEYISEAASREVELGFRKALREGNEVYNSVLNTKKDLIYPASSIKIPNTLALLQASGIETTAGGKITVEPKGFISGLDLEKTHGGAYGQEKNGNLIIQVDSTFEKTGGGNTFNRKWRFSGGFDFRVTNVVSRYGQVSENVPYRFDPNPANDYVLWVKAAGLQNMLSYGQVMHPKGQNLEISVQDNPKGRVMMGSGYGVENGEGDVNSPSNLDTGSLYINVSDVSDSNLPKLNEFNNHEIYKIGKANNVFSSFMDVEKQEEGEIIYKKVYKEAKDADSDDPSGDANKAKNEFIQYLNKLFEETHIQVGAVAIPVLKNDNPGQTRDGAELIDEFLNEAKPQVGDFLKKVAKVGEQNNKAQDEWGKNYDLGKNWRGSIEKGMKDAYLSSSISAFPGLDPLFKQRAGLGAFQAYSPIQFKNLLDKNMEGNFKKRFFQFSFVYWNTKETPKGEPGDQEDYRKEFIGNRPVFPLFFLNPLSGYPAELKTIIESYKSNPAPYIKGLGKTLDLILTKTKRTPSDRTSNFNKPTAQPLTLSYYNTDYRYNFEDANKNFNKLDVPVSGIPLYSDDPSTQSPKNYNVFRGWSGNRLDRYLSYYFKTEEDFKKSDFYSEVEGRISVNGVMVINSEFNFPLVPMTLNGKGFLISIGNMKINSSLSVREPGKDFITLFAKGVNGKTADIVISPSDATTDIDIKHLSLWALSDNYQDNNIKSASTIRTNGKKLQLTGNYVADRVGWATDHPFEVSDDENKLAPTGNYIRYSKHLAREKDVYVLSLAGRYNEWVYNRLE